MEQRLVSLLDAAAVHFNPNHVKPIHALVAKNPNFTPLFIKLLLLKPHTFNYAHQLFDAIPLPDPMLAHTFISASSKLSFHGGALDAFFACQRKGTRLPFFSVLPVLKACALLPAPREGKQLHCVVIASGFSSNAFIQTALIDFYSKNDDLPSARKVFDLVVAKDPVTYNCLISGYSKAGEVTAARQLFDQMKERTLVSWNSMISCYAHSDCVMDGIRLFERMRLEGVDPNEVTLVTVLSMCAKLGNLQMGLKVKKLIDGHPQRKGLIVRTAVMEMFVKGGAIEDARNEFDQMDHRDAVAWSAMIAGYAQNGRPIEALDLFDKMISENFKPNDVTLVSILSACSQLGSVDIGHRIGDYVEAHGYASSIYVTSALLDMYAKCGNIAKARCIFNEMHKKDVVSWNSMIHGLAYNGFANEAISLHKEMNEAKVEPTDLTFIGLLTACTHAGFVDLGLEFYDSMKFIHNIVPKVEHCACVVDLLCRSGRLNEAYSFICSMEVEPNVVIWGTLLSACRIHPHIELAERAMEKLVILEPYNSGNYVLLANLYANAGRWEDAFRMRGLMKDRNVSKSAAYSWIELGNAVYKFLVGDTSHARSDEIYSTLVGLDLLQSWHDSSSGF